MAENNAPCHFEMTCPQSIRLIYEFVGNLFDVFCFLAGWSVPVVDVVLHKIMLSGPKLEEVETFISSKIAKGMSDSEIAKKLSCIRFTERQIFRSWR